MTTTTIDNTADYELNKAITWQFDSAPHFVSTIQMFKDFFTQSTTNYWNSIADKVDLSDPEHVDDFGLSIWGKLLGIARPTVTITVDGQQVTRKISSELYRRLLIGRLRLAMSDASLDAYIDFVKYVFCNDDGSEIEYNVKATDGYDMSLTFTYTKSSGLTEDDLEQKALLENYPGVAFAYPAGVKSSVENDGPVFGFYEQVRDSNGDPLSTNLVITDQTIESGTYSYTKNGYTYTKTHNDFKIANLGNGSTNLGGTIAWDRFGDGTLVTQ